MTEAAGEAAVFFDPEDVPGAADIILKNLNESHLSNLRRKGLENAKRFSTENMIRQYEEQYQKLIKNHLSANEKIPA
jgi:glycosyltransferase involved in cell wall biosynthesis